MFSVVIAGEGQLRWGIVGLGRISHEFAVALKIHGSSITAVAAGAKGNDWERQARAQKFAATFEIPSANNSYDALATNPIVDVVYIGNTNNLHFQTAMKMLNGGKHVVLEKPTTLSVGQTKQLIAVAVAKKLFFTTNFWTRFFPALKYARETLQSGILGDLVLVSGDMAFQAVSDETDRFLNFTLGGGAFLDMGCYQIQFATLALSHTGRPIEAFPDSVQGTAVLNDLGVDINDAWTLQWNKTVSRPPLLASFTTSLLHPSRFETEFLGTLGRLVIRAPTNCPNQVDVYVFAKPVAPPVPCCGQPEIMNRSFKKEMPPYPKQYLPRQYPSGEGFTYMIDAVEKAILAGWIELPEISHAEQIAIAAIQDKALAELGYGGAQQSMTDYLQVLAQQLIS